MQAATHTPSDGEKTALPSRTHTPAPATNARTATTMEKQASAQTASAPGAGAGAGGSDSDGDVEEGAEGAVARRGGMTWIGDRLTDKMSQSTSTVPLSWMAFLTGLVDGLIYSRTQVWVGFQTGNMVQFSMNIAQYIYAPVSPAGAAERDPLLTTERALSFSSFFLASWAGSLAGKHLGRGAPADRTRWFLILSSVAQGLLLFAAAAILLAKSDDAQAETPDWHTLPPVVVLAALSMGLQSVQSQKLASPVFSTSVAYTATLTQIATDPQLTRLALSFHPVPAAIRRRFSRRSGGATEAGEGQETKAEHRLFDDASVKGRDLRVLAIACVAAGGGAAQSLLGAEVIGFRKAIAIAAGMKMFLAVVWCVPRGEGRGR